MTTRSVTRRISGPATQLLRSRAIRGGLWVSIGNILDRGFRFARIAILARVLCPEDFGLMAIVTLGYTVVDAIAFAPMAQAIIRSPCGASTAYLNTVFTFSLIRGTGLGGLMFLGAPLVASLFGDARLLSITRLAALTPIAASFINPEIHLLLKSLAFKRWTSYRCLSSLMSTVSAILLTVWLRNVWALVIALVIEQGVLSIVSYAYCSHRPALRWDRQAGADVLQLCRRAFAIPLLLGACLQAPTIILGRLTDYKTLGAFTLTLSLADIPTNLFTRAAAAVALPTYSTIEQADRLRTAWRKAAVVSVVATIPIAVVIVLLAPVFLTVAFGEQYASEAPVLRILMMYALFRMLANVTSPVLWKLGRPDADRTALVAGLVVLYPSAWVLTDMFGSTGMAGGLVLGWGATLMVVTFICERRLRVAGTLPCCNPEY